MKSTEADHEALEIIDTYQNMIVIWKHTPGGDIDVQAGKRCQQRMCKIQHPSWGKTDDMGMLVTAAHDMIGAGNIIKMRRPMMRIILLNAFADESCPFFCIQLSPLVHKPSPPDFYSQSLRCTACSILFVVHDLACLPGHNMFERRAKARTTNGSVPLRRVFQVQYARAGVLKCALRAGSCHREIF